MTSAKRRTVPARGSLRAALLGSLCLTGGWLAAQGPAAATEAQPVPALAQAETRYDFAIPAQDLIPALIAFTEVTGVQLFFDSALARDLDSPGVTGELAAEDALRRLLSGTGLAYRFTNPSTVTLERLPGADDAASGSAVTLDPLRVEGQRETAEGPVEGYAATRSGSGTKSDTPLIETPQAVSVVTADQIRDQGARTLPEAVRYAPGVRADTFGADPRNDWFLIRGYAAQENGYFLDGMQLQSTAFATWRIDPFVLERIDVVRGPSAALYGATNPGGLLNAVTKRPTADSFGEVLTGVNQHGNFRGGFDINEGEGDLHIRLTGIGNIGGTEVDDTDDDGFTLAPSILWTPDEDTSLTAYAYVSKERTNSQNFLPYVGTVTDAPFGRIPRDLFTSEPELDRFDRDQWMVGYDFEHALTDELTLRQKVRYAELEVDFQALYGGGYAAPPTAGMAPLARFNFLTQPEASEFTLDNQVHWTVATGALEHRLLAGFDYKRYRLDDEQGFELGSTLDLLDPVYLGADPVTSRYNLDETTQNQYGFYLQDQLSFGNLHVVLSGRYDHVTTDIESDLTPGSGTSMVDNAFSWRAGAIYNFENGIAPYASITRSFLPVVGTDTVTGDPFEPETGMQYEVGLKYQPPGWGETYLAMSAFHLVRENVVQTDGLVQDRQVGEVTTKGLEFEASADPMPGLKLTASASFYDIETTEGTALDQGKIPTAAPETLASLYADYTLQEGALAGLGFGGGVRYTGKTFADRANTAEVPSVTLFDAGVHYQLGNVRANLTATNLFDKEYVGSCSSLDACFYGEGREVMFTLSYAW